MQEFAVHNILSQPLPSFPQAWQANTSLALCGIHAVWRTVENHLPVQVGTKGVRILVQRLPIHLQAAKIHTHMTIFRPQHPFLPVGEIGHPRSVALRVPGGSNLLLHLLT